MSQSPEGAAEQPSSLEPSQPVPPDVVGRGREKFFAWRNLSLVMGMAVVGGLLTYIGVELSYLHKPYLFQSYPQYQHIPDYMNLMLLKTLAVPFGATFGMAAGIVLAHMVNPFKREMQQLDLLSRS